jgi:glutathione S-transferase
MRSCSQRGPDTAPHDWQAQTSKCPFFFGDELTGLDAVVFGALATTVLTPIESPIRDFLRARAGLVAYAERMRTRFFPELAAAPSRQRATQLEERRVLRRSVPE